MNKTKIEWVKNQDGSQGCTINPVKGLCPMGCSYCYARRMYQRFKWNPEIRYNFDWLMEFPHEPSRIFVGSTIELFGNWVKTEWLYDMFGLIKNYPEHTFIFLTKQPQNLIKWSPFPENCWVGISATDNIDFINRVGYLGMVKAKVKFISFEPLLKWNPYLSDLREYVSIADWLIIGQQTPVSTKTQPKIEWIKDIVHAADKAHIPIFLKDNLRSLLPAREPFWTPVCWHEKGIQLCENRFRQEFPPQSESHV